ncbi:MAG TPA: hypothetical protein EYG89_01670 [Bacteroidia bacterium]|nr:hypothetical protein [Bacteroidia bacterium]
MTNTIQLKQYNFVKYLFYYLIITLISNYIKTNYLINSLVLNNVNIALLSGHLSSIISSLFILLLFIIIIVICVFIRDVFFEEINLESIFDAIKSVIITFMIIELIRMLLIYFVLRNELNKIDVAGDIEQQLYNTDWYYYNSSIYTYLVIVGGLLFGIKVYAKEHKIIPSIVFSLVFLGAFYLINVSIFDLV